MTKTQTEILELLDRQLRSHQGRAHEAWMTPAEVSDGIGRYRHPMTAGGAARCLRKLVSLGLVEQRQNGVYQHGFPRFEYRLVLVAEKQP